MACIRTICVHTALNKSRLCARVRVLIMNMYGSFCGRYVRVPFCPARLVCACEIKGCRPPPVHSSSPSVAHTCIFPPSFHFSFFLSPFSYLFALSFFLSLFIPMYVDYATMSSVSYSTVFSFLMATYA